MLDRTRRGVVREILTDDHPILRMPSAPVDLANSELLDDVADLAATLADFRTRVGFGRGISAPQIGVSKRLIVLDLGEGPFALVNPTIITRSEATQEVWDDCMSLPGKRVLVERALHVSVSYTTPEGLNVTWPDLGPDLAELVQHEVDHLDGVLMTDLAIEGTVNADTASTTNRM